MQEIYIDDIGKGFPLVLVHGFLGSSAMWSPQKEFLSKYYRVIAPAYLVLAKVQKLNH